MKKVIYILLVLFIVIFFSMNNFGLSGAIEGEAVKLSTKEIIINNLKVLQEKNSSDDKKYNYKEDKKYKEIISYGNEAIPIIMELYKNNELDNSIGTIAAEVVQEISDLNIKQEYDIEWDNPNQFFKVWEGIEKTDEESREKLSKDVITLLNKYPDLATTIHKSNIKLPELEHMIPQGLTLTKENIIITAYDKTGDTNSKCFILTKTGKLINTVTLDNNSHVGAIAYDEVNNLFWIPVHDGELNAYDADDFYTKTEVTYKYTFDNVGDRLKNYENKLKSLIAYLTIQDNKLYLGSFDDTDKGLVKVYDINTSELGEITLTYSKEFKVPPKVQGIEFYNYKDETYMLLSCSYGRFNPSYIHIYKYNDDTLDYGNSLIKKVTLKLPPMLEQVTKTQNRLYALFESKAQEYNDCLEKIGYICIFDLDKIFAKWDLIEQDKAIEETETIEEVIEQ